MRRLSTAVFYRTAPSSLFQASLPKGSTLEAILACALPQTLLSSSAGRTVPDLRHKPVVLSTATSWTVVPQVQKYLASGNSSASPLVFKIQAQVVSSAKDVQEISNTLLPSMALA